MNSTQDKPESPSTDKPVVLFLCTRNSARSHMAEGWLRRLAGDQFQAVSAGLEPNVIHPMTIQVMDEVGISLDGHRSKSLMEYLGRVTVRHIFVVCEIAEKNCPRIWPFGGQLELWPFDDPAVPMDNEFEQLLKFREVRDGIEKQIREWLDDQASAKA